MKHIKLFENWFQDVEDNVDRKRFAPELEPEETKPEDTEETQPEPEEEKPEPREEPKAEEPTAPETYSGWLKKQAGVSEVVEAEEGTDNSNGWVRLSNGVSIQWEIDMRDYPFLSVSYMFDKKVIQLADNPAGDLARQFYKEGREYVPREWEAVVIKIGAGVPALIKDAIASNKRRMKEQDEILSGQLVAAFSK
jgi:hypothetical protein